MPVRRRLPAAILLMCLVLVLPESSAAQQAGGWAQMTTVGNPGARRDYAAVWTGTDVLVLGGVPCANPCDPRVRAPAGWYPAGRYEPFTDTWLPMALPPVFATGPVVWTGSELMAFGGTSPGGLAYQPFLDEWRTLSSVGAPGPRSDPAVVWTGGQVLIWGGTSAASAGAVYDPFADTWSPMTTVGAPKPRSNAVAVWTGSKLVVWGGRNGNQSFGDGAAYDPLADSWTSISPAGAPSPRSRAVGVWTGSQLLVWGGVQAGPNGAASSVANGARYDPFLDVWSPITTSGAPTRTIADAPAVWDGANMLIWLGNLGAWYNPISDTWGVTYPTGAPSARSGLASIWTGTEWILWGGSSGSQPLADGARYTPADGG